MNKLNEYLSRFKIKNNNLYFNKYRIFDGQLSFVLVPFIFYLIFFKNDWIQYFSYIMLLVAIVGSIDSYLKAIKYKDFVFFILLGILHFCGFYPLVNIKKYLHINLYNYLSSIFGIIIIYFLPYWPYEISRFNIIFILLIINIFFTLLNIKY